MEKRGIRALALLSGGLDSILAVRLIQEQGIEVTGVVFTSPFFSADNAVKAAALLGIELLVEDISDELLKLLDSPPHGFGKNLNPCVDCHALMVRKAGELMIRTGADFIITGEVLGERPKSQNEKALLTVAEESGYKALLLRPLSAKLLPLTKPEIDGLVDREKLMDISGRVRKPQLALAEKLGIHTFPPPAGGCLLTDPIFSGKIRELRKAFAEPAPADYELLKYGRVFFGEETMTVIGRDHAENMQLLENALPGDKVMFFTEVSGPLALLRGNSSTEDAETAAGLLKKYSRAAREAKNAAIEMVAIKSQNEIELLLQHLKDC